VGGCNISKPDEELPYIWDYPLVKQMHNACGLATVLMAIDPDRNPRLRYFLNEIFNLIKPLIRTLNFHELNEVEQDHYVLEYLLLKAQGAGSKQFLYDFLIQRFGATYEDQRAINNYLLTSKREKYLASNMFAVAKAYDNYILEGDLINAYMLEDELHTFKTDIELKVLMEIFGYQYIPTESGDKTGALFFTKQNAAENIERLCAAHINPDRRIIFGMENHWTLITGVYPDNVKNWRMKHGKYTQGMNIKDIIIAFNDPLGPDENEVGAWTLPPSLRFYVFEDRKENLRTFWDQIIAAVKADVPAEVEQMRRIDQQLHGEDVQIPTPEELFSYVTIQFEEAERERLVQKYGHFKPIEIPQQDWIPEAIPNQNQTENTPHDGWVDDTFDLTELEQQSKISTDDLFEGSINPKPVEQSVKPIKIPSAISISIPTQSVPEKVPEFTPKIANFAPATKIDITNPSPSPLPTLKPIINPPQTAFRYNREAESPKPKFTLTPLPAMRQRPQKTAKRIVEDALPSITPPPINPKLIQNQPTTITPLPPKPKPKANPSPVLSPLPPPPPSKKQDKYSQ
jgi:hypothetical protein